MDPNHVTGAAFKKMMVSAHGKHTYMPHEVKKAINELKLHKHVRDGVRVSKDVAKQVMHKLEERGLTHKVTGSINKYVDTAFRKERRRQEMIKKQNLDTRRQEIAAEKAAEAQKSAGKNGKGLVQKDKPVASALQGGAARSAWSSAPADPVKTAHKRAAEAEKTESTTKRPAKTTLASNPFNRTSTQTKPTTSSTPKIPPRTSTYQPQPSDETLDLAID